MNAVVVQVLIAQCKPKDSLRDQISDRMLDGIGVAKILETAYHLVEQLDALIDLLQQQGARV